MKKLLFLLLLGFGAAAQVTNAPRIPFVNIERLRTDPVTFTVRFQQNGQKMNISTLIFQCDIMERGISFVRISLAEGTGITKTDSSVMVSLTPQQVQLLRKDAYQYRLYTVSNSAQTTRLTGNFSLWNLPPANVSSYSPGLPAIVINYTASGSTVVGSSALPAALTAGNALTITGNASAYTISVNNAVLDGRYVLRVPGLGLSQRNYRNADSTKLANAVDAIGVRAVTLTGFSTASGAVVTAADNIVTAAGKLQRQIILSEPVKVATYATLTALSAPAKPTYFRVENDENKNLANTLYIWWPDGKRQWVAATDDN